MNLLYGFNRQVAAMIESIVWQGNRQLDENMQCIGVVDSDGRLVAGVAFHNWEPDAGLIEITAAAVSPRWASREIISRLLSYAFDTCGCQMVVERIAADNTRALRFNERLGFRKYSVPRLYGRDRDGFILTLTDDDWRGGPYACKKGQPHEQTKGAHAA